VTASVMCWEQIVLLCSFSSAPESYVKEIIRGSQYKHSIFSDAFPKVGHSYINCKAREALSVHIYTMTGIEFA